mgnify:CR=1 FL=1
MKNKKLLASLLAGAMVLSLAACGEEPSGSSSVEESTSEVQQSAEAEPTAEPAPEAAPASIDFEDGNMGFVAPYMQMANAADIELAVVDYNGSKALEVKNLSGDIPYVAFDATSLLGADVAKVASMEADVAVTYENGTFNAVEGRILAWSGEDRNETYDDWSVYLESKNPNKAVATLDEGEEFVADAGNIFILNLTTDNGANDGNGNATMYIDNIRFLDASGNLLTADSTVAFAAPEGFESSGVDMSNLAVLTNVVEFDGFAASAGEWAQAGFTMPQEIIDALVPGSVVEISYSSESGDMWIVMNEAQAGWMRVGQPGGEGTPAVMDGSKSYVTYEQLAALCGDDVSTWGSTMQCESSGAWEVYSVRVGTASTFKMNNNQVNFEGFATSAGEWAQEGFDMPQEIIDALVPGSVVNISYTSEDGTMWIVMPDAAAGWMRVGQPGGEGTPGAANGSVCQITYEQIAALCGEDKSTWGARMQCEASSAWEVYSVTVGQTPDAE